MSAKMAGNHETEARTAQHLRHLNLERLVVAAMERREPFTRAELTTDTSLSAPTVGNLMVHLIRNGLIKELGTGPSQGGRRPSFLEFNARYGLIAGVAVSPMKTRIAVGDMRGERIATRDWPSLSAMQPNTFVPKMATWLKTLLSENSLPADKLLSVAVSVAGTIDDINGIVLAAPNLKGWAQAAVGPLLKEALGGIPVSVETDTNLAILGERWRGAAVGHDSCALIYVGTGIGAGIVWNGELIRGHHFLAGKIGLMTMGPQFLKQDFGAAGCLETLASLKAIRARWSTPGASEASEKGLDELFTAAQRGDARAKKLVEETAELIAIAASHIALVVDPSLIVVAGAVAEHPQFLTHIRQVAGAIIPSPPEIVPAKLGKEGPLWGSLLLAQTASRDVLRQHLRALA
jgi:predicted NBD/HSP70 family sugar kinase